ncbi:MAG: DUF1566 domain-containing protein [Aestuariibacter sp.]
MLTNHSQKPFFTAMNIKRILFLSCLVFALTACGGSDGDSSSPPEEDGISVSAGNDITVDESEEVTLTGTASGSESFTYAWTTSNTDITIEHPDTAIADASFTAPVVEISALTITLTLTATAADETTTSDTLVVTVNPVNANPDADIVVTQDERFAVNTFPGAVALNMDGSASSDSDPITDAENEIVSYQWAQVSGTDITEDVTLTEATVSFVTPALTTTETLQFSLTVTDTEGGTNTETVDITVLDVTQTPPVVEAGQNITSMEGEFVVISGSATSLTTDALPYTFLWQTAAGDVVSFSDDSSAETTAILPELDSDGSATLSLTVTDQFGNSDSDTLTMTIRDLPITLMNDTGLTSVVNGSGLTTEPTLAYAGQDGELGRDRISANSALEKAGTGEAAFDFTKLNNLGDEVSPSATDWDCVRDNVTGLIWEVKTDDADLHDLDNTYSWYDEITTTNGGFDGDANGAGTSCTLTNCNTDEFISQVNSAGLCGFFDWRLPTHDELMSLVHFGHTTQTYIDETYFPNTSADNATPTWYWTSVPNVDGNSAGAALSSWAIDFSSGNDNFLNKSTAAHIRLVRAGR